MTKPLRILIVEDQYNDVLLLVRALRRGGCKPEYEIVDTQDSMTSALENGSWDVILCDYAMPKFNALNAIKVWKETRPDLPFIVVSGAIGEDTAVEAMRAGAHDYMMKGKLKRLVPAIERELGEAEKRRKYERASKALRDSELRYRTLFQSTADAVMLISRGGLFIDCNDAALRIFGYDDKKDFIGGHPGEVSPEKQLDGRDSIVAANKWIESADQEGSQSFEWLHRRKDGTVFPCDVLLSAMEIDGRNVFQAVIRDISERKRAEEALATSETLYRSTIQAMDDATLVVNSNLEITLANNAYIQLGESAGMRMADITGRKLVKVFPFLPYKIINELRSVFNTGEPLFTEETTRMRSGDLITDTRKIPVFSGGKVVRVVTIIRDVTELKRAEKALKESERRLKVRLDFMLTPERGTENLDFSDFIDLETLQKLQDAFSEANDVASVITDTDGNPITKPSNMCEVCRLIRATGKGDERCAEYRKTLGKSPISSPEKYQTCPGAGFANSCAPIIIAGKHIANWLIGQANVTDAVTAEAGIAKYADEIGVVKKDMLEAYRAMPRTPLEKFEKSLALLRLMAMEVSTLSYKNIVQAKEISDRKRAEEALAASETLYRSTIQAVDDAVQVVNSDMEITLANIAYIQMCESHGVDMSDAIGQNLFQVLPFLSDRVRDEYRRVFETGEMLVTEEITDAGEKSAFTNTRKIPVFSCGKVERVVTIVRDITEIKRAEEALKESQRRLKIKLDFILTPERGLENLDFSDFIDLEALQNIQDAFSDANEVASIISDLKGNPITKPSNFCDVCLLIRSTEKGAANCVHSDVILGAKAKQAMKPIYQKCLSCGFVDASAPIIVAGKHIANWFIGQVNTMDITEQMIADYAEEINADVSAAVEAFRAMPRMPLEKFEKSLALLWQMAKELSALAYNNIKQAKEIAERKRVESKLERLNAEMSRKNKEMKQLMYVTSHDLRAPLVNVQGFGGELEISVGKLESIFNSEKSHSEAKEEVNRILRREIPEALRYVRAGASKMDSLLSGLLKLSRLGRAVLTMKQIDMNELMADVAAAFEYRIKKAGARLEISDLPPCYGDKAQINQVFSNLLDNALKYLDADRSGIFRISGIRKRNQNVYCVRDNGIGIASRDRESIFELFHQLDPKETAGEGLGLNIAGRIVERHNGKIWVESEPDRGSKFFVSLPRE